MVGWDQKSDGTPDRPRLPSDLLGIDPSDIVGCPFCTLNTKPYILKGIRRLPNRL